MEESLSPAQRDQVLGLYAETLLTEFRSMVEKTAQDILAGRPFSSTYGEQQLVQSHA